MLSATESAQTKPAHTACTSKAMPPVMPSLACTLVAVAGKVLSGVDVASTSRSRESAPMPAASSAARLAAQARSEVSWSSAATWRWRMPVRVLIHSSLVSMRVDSSSLLSTRSGR